MLSSGSTIFDFMKKKVGEHSFKEAALKKMVEYFNRERALPSCEDSSLSETVHYKNAKKCTAYW